MATRTPAPPASYRPDQEDWISNGIEWLGGKLLLIGGAATLIATAFLLYYVYHFTSTYLVATDPQFANALSTITTLRNVLVGSLLIFALGMTLHFWGDIALPTVLLLAAVVFFFSPDWTILVGLTREGGGAQFELVTKSLGALRLGGLVLGIGALLLQVVDGTIRIRNRSLHGAKGDLIKYGSGAKGEVDYRNVLMGKCWQLPFCRKFVRERCPIFHSRRTCWKERVGCMCEEQVIQGAMEDKAIPRDVVAAAKFIPRNNRLTPKQKAERCRQCVIYNEHQRHKYRLAVPLAVSSVALVYFMFRQPLLEWTHGLLVSFDQTMSHFSFAVAERPDHKLIAGGPGGMAEIMLVLIMLFVIAQMMKVIEFSIFKLKI